MQVKLDQKELKEILTAWARDRLPAWKVVRVTGEVYIDMEPWEIPAPPLEPINGDDIPF